MRFPKPTVERPELTPDWVEGSCVAFVVPSNGRVADKRRESVEFEGEVWKASRLAYHLNVAPLSRTPASRKAGLVCHHCDNDWCLRHLYLGTASQNTKDIYERNEFVRGRQSESRRGNQNAKGNKFTPEQRARCSASKIGNSNKLGKKGHKAGPEELKNRRVARQEFINRERIPMLRWIFNGSV